MNLNMLEKLLRFQQPAKSLPYLNGLSDEQIAGLFTLDVGAYQARAADFTARTHRTAATLLENPAIATQVDQLPFTAGQHVVAIGESSTADRLSWFEILRQLLAIRRPNDAIRLTNLAVSGSTTTQALSSLPGLGFHKPDWVLCQLGANDAQRIGGPEGPRLVSIAETERNFGWLYERVSQLTSAEWIWLTPTAVDEARVSAFPHFERAQISWSAMDLETTAQLLIERPEPTIDVLSCTTPTPDTHLEDGVHLTELGQQQVTAAVVAALADLT
ncbi:SGNH/GDSL hydrolase family protein [Nocardia sp. NPDC051463]|uniref:SGNH/GDSL hydrolase family protein n=1 Tax=Nocardia sp. NPDC051463 TaxID=3154845 RepID=UPI00344BFB68